MITVAALLILALFLVLGFCVAAGWAADSRDSRFGLWPLGGAHAKMPTYGKAASRQSRRQL